MTIIGSSKYNAGSVDTTKTGASSNFTATEGVTYEIDFATGTPSSNLVVTLPASPSRGDAVGFVLKTEDGTYGVGLSGTVATATVSDGGPLTLMNAGDSIKLRYVNASIGWEIVGGNLNFAVEDFKTVTATTYNAGSYRTQNILGDASSNAITVNLPAVASTQVKKFYVRKTDTTANAVTLDANASETINGATTLVLANQDDFAEIVTDGTKWYTVSTNVLEDSVTTVTAATVTPDGSGPASGNVVLVDTSSNAVTVNLPAANTQKNRRFVVKFKTKGGSNNVTVDANASETIDGSTTQTLDAANECIVMLSDGTAWYIISDNR